MARASRSSPPISGSRWVASRSGWTCTPSSCRPASRSRRPTGEATDRAVRRREGTPIDVDRIEEALRLVEADQLGEAAKQLGPLVKGKRFTRPSRMNAEAVEVDEVKAWLREAIADPSSPDSRFMVERAYYKLRTQAQA